MALDFSRLQAEISENASAIDSAVALISQVADALRDAAGNQAKVNELADQLDARTNALAAAIVAGTPVATDAGDTPAPAA